ncbi:MAG: hypothetical protein IPN69_08525 [Acidobacteria bacterium]|nr:hypothetical protein [Acidobacteriota bacterium]
MLLFDQNANPLRWFAPEVDAVGWFDAEFAEEESGAIQGAVASLATATLLDSLAASQTQVAVIAALVCDAALSAPSGTQAQLAAVSNAASATQSSTPAATQSQSALVAGASTVSALSGTAATQIHVGVVSGLVTATGLSEPDTGGGAISAAVSNMTISAGLSTVACGRQSLVSNVFRRRYGRRAAQKWAEMMTNRMRR